MCELTCIAMADNPVNKLCDVGHPDTRMECWDNSSSTQVADLDVDIADGREGVIKRSGNTKIDVPVSKIGDTVKLAVMIHESTLARLSVRVLS